MPTLAFVTLELVEVEVALELANDPFQASVNTGVTTWNGRSGDVVPIYGDYTASLIVNTSGVTGTTVADALNTLLTSSVGGAPNLTTQYRMVYVESAGTLTESTTIVTDASGNLILTGDLTVDDIFVQSGTLEIKKATAGDTIVVVDGNGAGSGYVRAVDSGSAAYAQLAPTGLCAVGQDLCLQKEADYNVNVFEQAAEGETPVVAIWGRNTGDTIRTMSMGISSVADDMYDFSGVSNYRFAGSVGINTSGAPARELEVNGQILIPNAKAYLTKDNAGGQVSIIVMEANNNLNFRSSTTTGDFYLGLSNALNPGNLYFQTANTVALTIDASQNATFAGNVTLSDLTLDDINVLTDTLEIRSAVTDADTNVLIRGNNANGYGHLVVYDEAETQYVEIVASSGIGFIRTFTGDLALQYGSGDAVCIGANAAVGTEKLYVLGDALVAGAFSISNGASGATASAIADEFVVEDNAAAGISILTPDAYNSTLVFGSATDNDYAYFQGYYNAGAPFVRGAIQGTEIWRMSSTGIGINNASGGLTISDGSDTMTLSMSGNSGIINWSDGNLNLITDEGTDTISVVQIKGKGTGYGIHRIFDEDDGTYLELACSNNEGYLRTTFGTGALLLQNLAHANVKTFSSAAEGSTPAFEISGYRTSDASRTLSVSVGASANDQVDFTGLGTYYFDGTVAIETMTLTESVNAITFLTTYNANIDTQIQVKGAGTGKGAILLYDQGDDEYLTIQCNNGIGYVRTAGSAPSDLYLQDTAHADVTLFANLSEGDTQELAIWGHRTGDAAHALKIGVGVDAADTASFDNLSNYYFDGAVIGTSVKAVASLGGDSLTLTHDGTNAYVKWDDGGCIFQTDEGTDTSSNLIVQGKGTGIGYFRAYDEDNAEYLRMYCSGGIGQIDVTGSSPSYLSLQTGANADIYCFSSAAEGETRALALYGFRTGDSQRALTLGVSSAVDDAALFDGVSHYIFDGNVNANAIQLNTSPTVVEAEGMLYWNDTDYTLNLVTGLGPVQQVGQEDFILVYNGTGAQLDDGTICYPVGASGDVPSVAKASAHDHTLCPNELVILTQDIANGAVGFALEFRGKLRSQDTNSYNLGDTLYLDPAFPATGGFTNVRPEFPDYVRSLGGVVIKDPTDGVIQARITGSPTDTLRSAWDGCFRETIDLLVASDGATITGTLTSSAGLDHLTMMFSDGFTLLDVSTPPTITLTAGSATVPQTNFIYIPKSTKVLTVSTSDWPTTVEHIRVAKVCLLTAAITEEDGALTNQNWNDHVKKADQNGHLLHITEAIREKIGASWYTGCELTAATDGTSITISTTAGQVYQVHRQAVNVMDTTPYTIDAVSTGSKTFTISGDGDLSSTFPDGRIITVHDSTGNDGLYSVASTTWSDPDFIITVNETIASAVADGTIGDDIHIVNDSVAAYKHVLDLADQTTDASGGALLNTSYSVVIWGVANKTGQATHFMANMPTDTYSKTNPDLAVTDGLNYSVYDIPSIFNGVGFLLARVTFVNNSGTISVYNTQDLRGLTPSTAGGGAAGGGGVTTFLGLTDTPSSFSGQALSAVRVNAGETGLEFTTGFGDVNGGSNLTTQYRIPYVDSAGTITESSNITTDASGNLSVTGNITVANLFSTQTTCVLAGTAVDTNFIFGVQGNGTGYSELRSYDQDNAEYLSFYCANGEGRILTQGTSPGILYFQHTAHADIYCFSAAASGETPTFEISGFRAADAKRTLSIGISSAADDTALFDGVSNYHFDGTLSGTLVRAAEAGGDIAQLSHNGTDASIVWSDGALFLSTTETNTNSLIAIQGAGTGYGYLRTYDEADDEWVELICTGGEGYLRGGGTAFTELKIQDTADADVALFGSAGSGETPELNISGYRTGDAKRTLSIGISSATNDAALFDGVSNYVLDGDVEADSFTGIFKTQVNAQVGTTYTFVAGDEEKIVTCTNASAVAVTIPPNSSVAFPTNSTITVLQGGAGIVTVTGGTGVTVNGVSTGGAAISAQYSGITLLKTGTDTWIMFGDHGTVS